MKKIILIHCFAISFFFSKANDLELQGIIDFDLISGGYSGKAIHLFANNNILDLSNYGIGVANNGNGSHGEEFSFPNISLQAGDHLLLARDTTAIANYLNSCYYTFDYIMLAPIAIDQNGNDAIELYKDSVVIETFGDIYVDGTGTEWEYLDSWAYKDPSATLSFSGGNWYFGEVECTIGSLTTQTSSCVYPFCDASVFVDKQFENKMFLYPNPSSDFIALNYHNKIVSVEIYSIIGEKINNYKFSDRSINIKHLSKGLYFLLCTDNKNIITKNTFIKD